MKKGDRVIHKDRAQRRMLPDQKKKGALIDTPPITGIVDTVIEYPENHPSREMFPSGVSVNVVWEEPVQDAKRGLGRVLSHDQEELVPA